MEKTTRPFLILLVLSALLTSMAVRSQDRDSLEQFLPAARGKDRVKVLNQLYIGWINSDPVKASAFNREALTLAREIGDSLGLAKAINNLGHLYRNHGALDKALEYYLQAEGLFIRLADQQGIAASQSNIGIIHSYKKDFEKAKSYFEGSVKIFLELRDTARLAGVFNNLGNVWLNLNDQQRATTYFRRSISFSQAVGQTPADPMINLANVQMLQGDSQDAIETLNRAAGLAENSDNKQILLSIQIGLGNAWLKAGKLSDSEKALKKALELSKSVEAYVDEPQIFKSLAENYARQGRMADAYANMLLYEEARELYFSDESSRKIAQMEMMIDIHEKEKELEALRQQEALSKLELQRTQLAITLIIISLLSSALLVNLYIQKRKARRKA